MTDFAAHSGEPVTIPPRPLPESEDFPTRIAWSILSGRQTASRGQQFTDKSGCSFLKQFSLRYSVDRKIDFKN